MTLSATILDLIPTSGCTLKALRSALHRDHPHVTDAAIDHALVGLRARNVIHVQGGTVTVVGKAAMPTATVEVERTPEQIAAARETRRLWSLANADKIRTQRERQDKERRSTRRERIITHGSYAAMRIAEIEGEA